jgi:hypothetical protein
MIPSCSGSSGLGFGSNRSVKTCCFVVMGSLLLLRSRAFEIHDVSKISDGAAARGILGAPGIQASRDKPR